MLFAVWDAVVDKPERLSDAEGIADAWKGETGALWGLMEVLTSKRMLKRKGRGVWSKRKLFYSLTHSGFICAAAEARRCGFELLPGTTPNLRFSGQLPKRADDGLEAAEALAQVLALLSDAAYRRPRSEDLAGLKTELNELKELIISGSSDRVVVENRLKALLRVSENLGTGVLASSIWAMLQHLFDV